MYVVCAQLDDGLSASPWIGLVAVGELTTARVVAEATTRHLQLAADQIHMVRITRTESGWDVRDVDADVTAPWRVATAAVEFLVSCGRAAAFSLRDWGGSES